MAEEMRFHLEQQAADYRRRRALSRRRPGDAAQRKFGNLGSLQEQAREGRGWGWLDRTLKDFRLALRQLAGSPGFTLLAILTLALGIGVNTASFSMFNGIILKSRCLYPEAARLDRIYPQHGSKRATGISRRLTSLISGMPPDGARGSDTGYTLANVRPVRPRPSRGIRLWRAGVSQFSVRARDAAAARARFSEQVRIRPAVTAW